MKPTKPKRSLQRRQESGVSPNKGYVSKLRRPLDLVQVSTRALIITALATGLVILAAFAVQVLIAT